ncbi:MAG: Precorrin-6B methylase 2 [Lachnospiraceae bacterium]|nr:Precorrin-6B methylase 2 [Lachnospiraceae bacterium]
MEEKIVFTYSQMLGWLGYISSEMNVSPEKIKLLNACGKRRNILSAIATHKRVLIFADETRKDMLYKCWEAGYGEYDVWYGKGVEPSELKKAKIQDLMDNDIKEPMVFYVVNENTRESMIFGMKNENFSAGSVRYVGHEIRAVIMNKLELDASDTISIVSGESIVIEASMMAYEGLIIAVERDKGSLRSMEENIEKFGVHNVEIVQEVTPEAFSNFKVPRLAFIVATKRNIESDIMNYLKINPEMKFVIYTLELDILSDIKYLLNKYGVEVTEVMQISVSKTNNNSEFVTQPTPFIISAQPISK